MLNNVICLVVVGLACSSISTTITRSKLSAPVRNYIRLKYPLIGEGLSCPYCVAHWIGFFLVLLSGIKILDNIFVNFFVLWFAVVALAAIFNGVIMRLNFMHEHEIERLEASLIETQGSLKEIIESLNGE